MSSILNVQVVRPKRTATENVASLLSYFVIYLINGWFLMLAAGMISPWHPGYWESVFLAFVIRSLIANTDYLAWTKAAK